jgi:hypothetical protein
MKQTAVQWCTDKIDLLTHSYFLGAVKGTEYYNKLTDIVKQAMELEKEQMKEFFFKGDSYSCSCYDSPIDADFEEFYNQTYEK